MKTSHIRSKSLPDLSAAASVPPLPATPADIFETVSSKQEGHPESPGATRARDPIDAAIDAYIRITTDDENLSNMLPVLQSPEPVLRLLGIQLIADEPRCIECEDGDDDSLDSNAIKSAFFACLSDTNSSVRAAATLHYLQLFGVDATSGLAKVLRALSHDQHMEVRLAAFVAIRKAEVFADLTQAFLAKRLEAMPPEDQAALAKCLAAMEERDEKKSRRWPGNWNGQVQAFWRRLEERFDSSSQGSDHEQEGREAPMPPPCPAVAAVMPAPCPAVVAVMPPPRPAAAAVPI